MSCDTGVCGVGGWDGPLPGDPSNDGILTATPAFGGIDVAWSLPTTLPWAVAYTKVYRALIENFDAAIWVKDASDTIWYDREDSGVRYYYWIRFISVNGTAGELIGPASAAAKPLIEDMIELLTGRIDSGLLATSLKNQLGQISVLNDKLLQETMDRQGDQVSLAQAIQDANDGVAAAHTYMLDAVDDLITRNQAVIEQVNGIAATVGADYGAVIQNMQVSLDGLQDTVSTLYTVQLTANGLIGGFGLANNGASVEAGFDVDEFWIGRTGADKRKPFIIEGGVVYLDEAAINHLTFSKLRDESGSFIVENGKVKASYLEAMNITFDKLMDTSGHFLVQDGRILGDYLQVKTASIDDLAVTTGKIAHLAVDTLQVADNAVTFPVGAFSVASVNLGAGGNAFVQSAPIITSGAAVEIFGGAALSTSFGVDSASGVNTTSNSSFTVAIYRDGTLLNTFGSVTLVSNTNTANSATGLIAIPPLLDKPPAGSHTYQLWIGAGGGIKNTNSCSNRSLLVMEVKK